MIADTHMSSAEITALSERLQALYSTRTFGELVRSSIELLRPFFSADYFCIGLCEPRRSHVIGFGWPTECPMAALAERVQEFAEQSPLFRYWSTTRDHDRVLRRTDCCDEHAFRSTGLYSELFRPLSFTRQIGAWVRPGGGRHVEIGMYRCGETDFSDIDVARLSLLRGHILQAYANLLEREAIARRPAVDDLEALAAGTFLLQRTSLSAHLDSSQPSTSDRAVPSLTPRERDVLALVVKGQTNQEIAAALGTKWRTVSKQLESIFRKLEVETRTAAAIRAIELRLDH